MDSQRDHDRIYRAALQSMADGLILGRGRHGVVVALTNEPADPWFSLAVKIVSKVFTPSKGKEPSFHRVVSHTLHVQNEVAAMAKLSAESTFVLPLFCAFQDDTYVYLVMERACCSLKQLIQHADEMEQEQLLTFQEAHPLKFLSFCVLLSAAMLHACWVLQRARIIHHDIHPAQVGDPREPRPCKRLGSTLTDRLVHATIITPAALRSRYLLPRPLPHAAASHAPAARSRCHTPRRCSSRRTAARDSPTSGSAPSSRSTVSSSCCRRSAGATSADRPSWGRCRGPRSTGTAAARRCGSRGRGRTTA